MKNPLMILAVIGLLLAAYVVMNFDAERPPRQVEGLPWQVESFSDGTAKVFGVTLGQSNLDEAVHALGPDYEMAVVVTPDESGSLEVYYHRYTAGLFTGKLVVVAEQDADLIDEFKARAVKTKPIQTGARLLTLHPDDVQRAYQMRVASITFVPSINLDEAIAVERFGTPADIIPVGDTVRHLLYPDQGVDVLINTDGKEVMQYVPPRDFNLLEAPLRQSTASP